MSRPVLITLLLLGVLTLGLSGWGLRLWWRQENRQLSLTTYRIRSPKIPPAFSGWRLVHLSDPHNTQFGEGNNQLLELLRSLKPDLICLTGDLLDSYAPQVDLAASWVERAQAIAPLYYVTGNHEARLLEAPEPHQPAPYPLLEERLKRAGVTILHGQSRSIVRDRESLNIIGLDDPYFASLLPPDPQRIELSNLARHLDPQRFNIVLCHRPELFSLYAQAGCDLVLTGHAHGGQIRCWPFPNGLLAPNQGFWPRYTAGLYTQRSTHMLVSRGLGDSLLPLRINNRPQVIVIELLAAEGGKQFGMLNA